MWGRGKELLVDQEDFRSMGLSCRIPIRLTKNRQAKYMQLRTAALGLQEQNLGRERGLYSCPFGEAQKQDIEADLKLLIIP